MKLSPKLLLLAAMFISGGLTVYPQPTTFTYQGVLSGSNVAPNGPYYFRFTLHTDPVIPSQIGPVVSRTISLQNGGFSAQLDFGNVFNGSTRYLEIQVKALGEPNYTTLSPRWQIDWTPYAIRSNSSDSAESLGGIPASGFVQTNDARLTDARQPLPGSSSYIQNTTTTQATSNFNISGTGSASVFNASQYNLGGTRVLSSP